jgi:selenocysteine lyase/cysteine desulfurase
LTLKIGLANIQVRVRRLVAHFCKTLSSIPGVRLHTPTESELAAGLVTCSFPGWEAESLSRHLWESRRILTNFIRELNALRFLVAFFDTAEELETTAEAVISARSVTK